MSAVRATTKDLKNSGSQNIVTTIESTTPLRGISNRNRHVNPYIQSKNRQGSMIGNKNLTVDPQNSLSRNQTSQDETNALLIKAEEKGGLLTNQSVSPIAGSPMNSKNAISPGLLQNLMINDPKLQKNRSFINQNESVKSTSLEKRAMHSGVTAHTFSSSLKQKIDRKNQ
jgi:hypothetical protein